MDLLIIFSTLQFPRVQSDVFKLLICSTHSPKHKDSSFTIIFYKQLHLKGASWSTCFFRRYFSDTAANFEMLNI